MTAWAVLALVAAGRAHTDAVSRAARFLVERQREDGSYPPEHIAGMFNKTCTIHYENYLKVFPLWALGAVRRATQQRGIERDDNSIGASSVPVVQTLNRGARP